VRDFFKRRWHRILFFRRPKIFCVGANKTGTTTVAAVFRSLGLRVGTQALAELLLHDWARKDYRNIIRYCRFAEAYQDIPFSYPDTYRALDTAFPGSKFILTVRDDAEKWFESLTRFHTKIVGKNRLPTADDLREFPYRYRGFLWNAMRLRYSEDEALLYDRDFYIQCYEAHNNAVREYFKHRPGDLLELNVAEPDAMERLLAFLGYPYSGQQMPHMNSSKNRP
jgi:hypothetical protein